MSEKVINVEAREVKVGDLVYDDDFFGTDKWVRVKAVRNVRESVVIDLGYVDLWKHPRQGVAVKSSRTRRGEAR